MGILVNVPVNAGVVIGTILVLFVICIALWIGLLWLISRDK